MAVIEYPCFTLRILDEVQTWDDGMTLYSYFRNGHTTLTPMDVDLSHVKGGERKTGKSSVNW